MLVFAAVRQLPEQLQPVPIVPVPAPTGGRARECAALMEALPDQLGDYRRAPWTTRTARAPPHGRQHPMTSRSSCGADWTGPPNSSSACTIQVVEPVQWFELTDADSSTWFAVDRPVYIALTLPSGSGPTPIQEISAAISQTMPAKPIDPAPAR